MMKLSYLIFSVLAGLIIYGPSVNAHQGATGIVKERMNLMKDIKEDMKQVKKLALSKDSPGSRTELEELLRSLQSHAKEILPLFPDGSLQHPTEALPEIWRDWPGFKNLTTELGIGLNQLEQSLQEGKQQTIKLQLKKISKTCSDCHDKFREEK